MAARPKVGMISAPTWTPRDRLLLAELVVKCGNQNWPQVSKHMRQNTKSHELHDFFSTKNCALQYSNFLETFGNTKRQKRHDESSPASMDAQIEAQLRDTYIKHLEQSLQDDARQYKKLAEGLKSIEAGTMSDADMETVVKDEAERAALKAQRVAAVEKEREQRARGRPSRRSSTASAPNSPAPTPAPAATATHQTSPLVTSVSSAPAEPAPAAPAATTPATPTPIGAAAAAVAARAGGSPARVPKAEQAGTKGMAPSSAPAIVVGEAETLDAPSPAPSASEDQPSTRAGRPKRGRAAEGTPEPTTSTRSGKRGRKKDDVSRKGTASPRFGSPAPADETKPASTRSSRRATRTTAAKGKGRGRRRLQEEAAESVASATSSRASPIPGPDSPLSAFSSPSESSDSDSDGYDFEEDLELDNARARKTWRASIMTVWNQIAGLKDANLFRHPVTNDVAEGYSDVVFKPMDLGTIKKRVETGEIATTKDFEHDILLMLSNALMYNDTDHFVYEAALVMRKESVAAISNYKDTMRSTMPEERLKGRARRREVKQAAKARRESVEEAATPRTKRRRQETS